MYLEYCTDSALIEHGVKDKLYLEYCTDSVLIEYGVQESSVGDV